jgi:hypothetical protein
VYVLGTFKEKVTCYLNNKKTEIASDGESDCYLCKYNPDGNLIWIKTWGSSAFDIASSVALDSKDNVVVSGSFPSSSDFDPGSGTEIGQVSTCENAFLSKFSDRGTYIWSKTWALIETPPGNSWSNPGVSIALDSDDNIYAGSMFLGNVDLDPGSQVSMRQSMVFNSFLTKFNNYGDLQWVETWGNNAPGKGLLRGTGLSTITVDSMDNVWVAGNFWSTIDLDPGPGVFERTSNSEADEYFSVFDPSGNFNWGTSWGGNSSQYVTLSLAPDNMGDVYAGGCYLDLIKFPFKIGSKDSYTRNYTDSILFKFRAP